MLDSTLAKPIVLYLNRQRNTDLLIEGWKNQVLCTSTGFLKHREMMTPPKFIFSVIQPFKDPLSRMVKEAVLIRDQASMNSKSEFRGYKIARLTVEKQDWEVKKDQDSEAKSSKELENEMLAHKADIERFALAQSSASNQVVNPLFSCRKRKVEAVMEPKTPNNFVTIGGVVWNGPKKMAKKARKCEPSTSTPVHALPSKNCEPVKKVVSPVIPNCPSDQSTDTSQEIVPDLSSDASEVSALLKAMDRSIDRPSAEVVETEDPPIKAPEDNVIDAGDENLSQNIPCQVTPTIEKSHESVGLQSEPSGSSTSMFLLRAMSESRVVCENLFDRMRSRDNCTPYEVKLPT